MAFIMFAARKLQVIRELNSKNYELTLITEQHKEATRKVADAQEAQNAAKNQVNIFTSQLQGLGQNAAMAVMAGQIKNGQVTVGNQQEQMQAYQVALQQGSLAGNQLAQAVTSITESIFSAQNKAELARLTAQANTLELRQHHLQSELKVLQEEKGNMEKAEAESVKSLTPQFGLA